jgi:hypothetical protein
MARGLGTAIALIGAGMGGYAQGKRDLEDETDRKTRRARAEEDRAFDTAQRDRTVRLQKEGDALTASMKAAAATGGGSGMAARAQADVLTKAGKPLEAQQLRDFADRMDNEGALKFIDANVRNLKEPGEEFALSGLDEFNAAGHIKAPPGAKGRSTRIKLPNGQQVNDFEVIDADGKVILPSARRVEALYGLSRAERMRAERDDFKDGRTAQHQADTLKATTDYHAGQLKISQQNADTASATQRSTAGHQARMADIAAAGAEPKVKTAESTFDQKTAADIAKDTVKREAEEAGAAGKPMTGAQIAKRTDEIVHALFVQHQNRFGLTMVQSRLGMAANDPQLYAREYGEAVKRVPQQVLAQMGFNPPAQAAQTPVPRPNPAAARATGPAQPADPGGGAVDTARQAHMMAQQALMKWGSRQRAADPAGFAQAQAAAEATARQLQLAEADYARQQSTGTVPRMMAQP